MSIQSELKKGFATLRTIIQRGLDPVTATGKTRDSVAITSRQEGLNVVVEIKGHSDIEGVLFGLGPGEQVPSIQGLSDWLLARSLPFDPVSLSSKIALEGTKRKDFGFVGNTESLVRQELMDIMSTELMDNAVFDGIDRKLGIKR